jgi:hypothetical protein
VSRARKPNSGNPQQWEPLQKAVRTPLKPEHVEAIHREGGPDADKLLKELAEAEIWKNGQYTVVVTRWTEGELAGQVQELSIRRDDRKPARDWRDFQRIKTQLAGADVEAVELYPAESRLMDTANQYYLFCLPAGQTFPFGFAGQRNVKTAAEAAAVGATQRELPEDWTP